MSDVATTRERKKLVLETVRATPHFSRKLYHMLAGLTCYTIFAFLLSKHDSMWVLGTIGGTFIVIDIIRLRNPKLNALCLRYFGTLMRREELNRLSANSYYVMGMFIVGMLLPKPFAEVGLLYLAFGDPIAAIVGTKYGKTKLFGGKKSVEGTVANFAVSTLLTLAVVTLHYGVGFPRAVFIALVGGAVSATVEAIPWPVNDNLSIPVISASVLLLLAELTKAW